MDGSFRLRERTAVHRSTTLGAIETLPETALLFRHQLQFERQVCGSRAVVAT